MKGHEGMCPGCMGWNMLILGVLIGLNAYFNVVGWAMFIAIIAVLKGIMGIVKGRCNCKKR